MSERNYNQRRSREIDYKDRIMTKPNRSRKLSKEEQKW